MIDKERRKKLASHLRHLSTGLISNDEFEENIMEDVTNGWLPDQYFRAKESQIDDGIIIPILELCWGLYDDTRMHKLIGSDTLSDESLKIIRRCILFLRSDYEYEWPNLNTVNPLLRFSILDLIKTIFTFGYHYHSKKMEQGKAFVEFKKAGDYEVWPFFRISDYEKQLSFPIYLSRVKA